MGHKQQQVLEDLRVPLDKWYELHERQHVLLGPDWHVADLPQVLRARRIPGYMHLAHLVRMGLHVQSVPPILQPPQPDLLHIVVPVRVSAAVRRLQQAMRLQVCPAEHVRC